jgi:2'-5' RNA ligase
VLWIGVEAGSAELRRLARSTDEALAGLGFDREKRPYSPHLTLGRVRSADGIQSTLDAMHRSGFDGGSFEVSDVFVMRSELKPTGAVYSSLEVIKLQG